MHDREETRSRISDRKQADVSDTAPTEPRARQHLSQAALVTVRNESSVTQV